MTGRPGNAVSMTPTMSGASRLIAALLAAGAVAYTSWALKLILGTGVNPLRASISDLAAAGRPQGRLFRTGDLVAACAARQRPAPDRETSGRVAVPQESRA